MRNKYETFIKSSLFVITAFILINAVFVIFNL